MRIRLLPILPTILLLNFGCAQKVNCPSFESEITAWLPYQTSDELVFGNSQNDETITFIVNDLNIQHTSHYDHKSDCGGCDDYFAINVYDESSENFGVEIFLTENLIRSEKYTIRGTVFSDYSSTYEEKTNYNLNGTNYEQVKIFTILPTNNTYTRLVIAKDYGIIELTDSNGINWNFVHKNRKSTTSVAIVNTSCD